MKCHIHALALIAALGYCVTAWGQTATRESSTARDSKVSAGDIPIRARLGSDSARAVLRKRVQEVNWDEKAFEEVIDWLKGLTDDKVNIVPRWGPFEVEGVDRDSPVTLQLRDVTVAEVLGETLDQLSEEGQVTYHAYRNTLKFSTKSDFDRKLFRRVYEVTDILFQVPDFGRSAPSVDLEAAARAGGGGGGGGGGQSIFAGGGGSSSSEDLEQEESEVEERIEDLRTLIMDTVLPETWEDAGGPGIIRVYDNRYLVVLATIEVHEQLAGYFTR